MERRSEKPDHPETHDSSVDAKRAELVLYWLEIDGEQFAMFLRKSPEVELPRSLTPAERAVAALLLEGLSNAEIAEQTGRAVRTVANQVASILRKSKCPSRAAFVAKVTQRSHGSR